MINENQHRLVIIGSQQDFVGLVELAKERGIYTIVCDGYENGPAKQMADKAYTIDIRDVNAVAKMCIEEKADGITGSFSDLIFEQITKIAAKANLRWYVTPEMLPYYREKDKMKILLQKLNISVPKNKKLSGNFANGELADLKFPLVIKPLDGYGSKGIRVAKSVDEIRQLYDDVVCQNCWHGEDILVEEYIQGREYNIMSWLVEGKVYPIALGDREKNPLTDSNIPLLNRVVYPARDYQNIIDKAIAVLQKFAEATGQKDGSLSMQFFYIKSDVVVCEIAGRMFGYEEKFIEDCSGLNVNGLLLDYVYDKTRLKDVLKKHNAFFSGYFASLYFLGEYGKKIKDNSVCQQLAQDRHVMESRIYYDNGEVIDGQGARPYLARYYLKADSYAELDEVTQNFFNTMRVEAVDGGEASIRFFLQQG